MISHHSWVRHEIGSKHVFAKKKQQHADQNEIYENYILMKYLKTCIVPTRQNPQFELEQQELVPTRPSLNQLEDSLN